MQVELPDGAGLLEGDLVVPEPAAEVVVFAHGSGSSRFSPRNREVAVGLQRRGIGTLLVDLLTDAEGRVDDDLLAARLVAATEALRHTDAAPLPVGYFGASTGAAAALVAAGRQPGA